jgi:6-phosphogluconolactonase (cycloisomerase 2 family)
MKRWVGRIAVAMIGLAVSLSTGCKGFFVYPGSVNNSSTTSGDYVYVVSANTVAYTLAGFSVGTGSLTAVSGSPISLNFAPNAVAVNPANTIVYIAGDGPVSGSSANPIYAFAIESGGALSALGNNGSPVEYANVVSMTISPDGQWLLALDGNGSTVDEFQIDSSTGGLTPYPVTVYNTSVSSLTVLPTSIAVAPNGQLVFISLGTAGDLVYTFNTTTGGLTSSQQLLPPTTTTSDNALAVSPDSSYLYIARSGTDGGLAAYSIGYGAGAVGALTPVSGSPFTTGNQPFSVVVNSAGTDVYVANQLSGTISAYSVGANGVLTSLGPATVNGSSVTALAIDSTGDYLLAVARGGTPNPPDLAMYSLDTGIAGELTLSTTADTGAGTEPAGAVGLAMTH